MSSLLDNISSDFIAAYTALQPKNASKNILVYVESHDDQAFWRSILNQFENEKFRFDIQLPSKSKLSKGKNKALAKDRDLLNLDVGTYLIDLL